MLEVVGWKLLSEDLLASQTHVTQKKTTSQEEDNEEWGLLSIKQNSERNVMTNLYQRVNKDNTFALSVYILWGNTGDQGPQHLIWKNRC